MGAARETNDDVPYITHFHEYTYDFGMMSMVMVIAMVIRIIWIYILRCHYTKLEGGKKREVYCNSMNRCKTDLQGLLKI